MTDVKTEKLAALILSPTKEMLDAGQSALDDCVDTDWDSDCDGNRYDYTTIRSDAAAVVFKAMVRVALKQVEEEIARLNKEDVS